MAISGTLPANARVVTHKSTGLSLQFLAGLFFAFRTCLTYLAFQSDPRAGTVATLLLSGLLFVAALIYTLGDERFSVRSLVGSRTLKWLYAYLAVTGLSLFWTAAESPAIAAGYWAGMVMDVLTAVLIIKPSGFAKQIDELMKGFVIGTLFVSAVAWFSPTLPDLRIGNEEFLHPNWIGLICALAFFFAQHLAFEDRVWRWCCLALGITLLRSISKTSIAAFLVAEAIYLLQEKQLSTWMKIKLAAVAAVIVAVFWGLLESYFTTYSTNDNAPETLTGRTIIWGLALGTGLEQPWFGHGLYSFRALVPAIGVFEAAHAHDELIQQFFEFGLLGVGVTIGLYLSLFLVARRWKASRYGKLAQVLVIFCVIRGLADTLNFGLSLPLWLFAALAITLLSQTSESRDGVRL